MSYADFLLWFLLPPLAMAAFGVWQVRGGLHRRRLARPAFGALAAYTALAVAWTTPWDSWLIAHDVWRHGDVTGRALRVPTEEYLFMVGQSLIVGLFAIALLAGLAEVRHPVGRGLRWAAAGGWVAAAVAAWALHPVWDRGFYLTAIVGWFAPLLAVQAAAGADRLAARRRVRRIAVAVPVLYLWIADCVAIRSGTWWINPARTTGWRPFGLPVEEAAFFLVTTMLLVNGMVLALDAAMWRRAAQWVRREPVTVDG
jgi:lycopene beta-cyclase